MNLTSERIDVALVQSLFNCKIKEVQLDIFLSNPFSLLLRNSIVKPIISCDDKRFVIKTKSKGDVKYITNLVLSEVESCKVTTQDNYVELVLSINKLVYRILVVK